MDCSRGNSMLGSDVVVRVVTMIMGTVVGLTFLFGFGNVLSLGLRLGVPVWVAPLVAPAVDLSILGLLLGIRHLALTDAPIEVLRPARRLLIFASTVTLALNVADPVVSGEYGKAAFDAVGPLLLIGWAEVGPGFLQSISASRSPQPAVDVDVEQDGVEHEEPEPVLLRPDGRGATLNSSAPGHLENPARPHDMLLDLVPREDVDRRAGQDDLARARRADARHWETHKRPISSESLRKELEIGADLARELVAVLRNEVAAKVSASAV